MTDTARWKATVYVGGLSPLATNGNVLDAFIPFGEIVEVKLPKPDAPNSTEPHRGFAYVEYDDSADAKEAIDNMDQSEFFGRVLKVSPAKPPKSADEGLGSKTAVWEKVQTTRPFYTYNTIWLILQQEGWLAEHAANQEEFSVTNENGAQETGPDPMQGLEGLDVAGPRPQ